MTNIKSVGFYKLLASPFFLLLEALQYLPVPNHIRATRSSVKLTWFGLPRNLRRETVNGDCAATTLAQQEIAAMLFLRSRCVSSYGA